MTHEDKIYELEQRIAYYKNQNLMIDNKERLSSSDYERRNQNVQTIKDIQQWIEDLNPVRVDSMGSISEDGVLRKGNWNG